MRQQLRNVLINADEIFKPETVDEYVGTTLMWLSRAKFTHLAPYVIIADDPESRFYLSNTGVNRVSLSKNKNRELGRITDPANLVGVGAYKDVWTPFISHTKLRS